MNWISGAALGGGKMAKHPIPVEDVRLMRQAAHNLGDLHTDILVRNAAARGTAIVLQWQGAELRRRSAEIRRHAAMLRGDSLELRQWAAGCRERATRQRRCLLAQSEAPHKVG